MTVSFKNILWVLLALILAHTALGYDLSLWPRGSQAYLVSGYNMPVWPVIPNEFVSSGQKIEILFEMPCYMHVDEYNSYH